jgi:hypothetical protein
LKKQLGIFVVLAIIIGASCVVAISKLQPIDRTADTLDITPPSNISSDTEGSWHSVITFTGANYTQTDQFYIEGDKFRVKYTATPLDDIDRQIDDKSFIVVQAKNQDQNDDFLYGHVNENLDTIISGILEVDQGNGYYHLLIWDRSFANWQIEVESYH